MYFDELKKNVIDPDWCMIEERFEVDGNRNYESLFALGTGYMTTRATIEEGLADDPQALEYDRFPGNVTLEVIPASKSRWGTFMPVIGARHPFWRTGLVNLPYYLGLAVSVDGEKLDMETSHITGYLRFLQLKTATLYRTFTWNVAGKKVELLFTRFMNPADRFVCIQQCRIRVLQGDADLRLESYVDNDVRTNGYDKFTARRVGHDGAGIIFSDVTTNMDSRIVTATTLSCDRAGRDQDISTAGRRITASLSFRLSEGEEAVAKKASATVADAYFEKDRLVDVATNTVRKAAAADTAKLHAAHRATWASWWAYSDIEIDADEKNGHNSQLAIRSAVYHLLRAKAQDEDRGMICPKGTVTEVYMGATFWDMEIFILPFYLYTNNRAARTVPMFRCRNLPAARRLTEEARYKGVRYPWMSAFDGSEVCPMWQYAEHQVHITADVVIGIWHYYLTTHDTDFLCDHGAEVIIETARYWTQRAEKIRGRDGYHIYGVMGPDEYKPLTNNNAYTNYAARLNLQVAAETMEIVRQDAPDRYAALAEKIGLNDNEAETFLEVADGLPIAKDEDRHIVWQCEHFDDGFVDIDIEGLWADKSRLFGMFVSQEKRYRSKTLKQSDVVALMAVFPHAFSNEEKTASFDYYDPYNTQESSNSMCHHQIVAANIGRTDLAYESWLKSADIDFGKMPRSSEGLHFANVGGMWQEIVFGFAGMRSALAGDVLSFFPCLPPQFRRLAFHVLWKKDRIRVELSGRQIKLTNCSDKDVFFEVAGKKHLLKANDSTTVAY
jgi:trehalose/maltose hydrolase-like predicted phosphorylase